MHIHGAAMSSYALNPYFVGNSEKAAAARRAADVRKKLMRSASDMEAAVSPDEAVLIGHWLDSRHSQVQSEDQYYPSATGKDPDFG